MVSNFQNFQLSKRFELVEISRNFTGFLFASYILSKKYFVKPTQVQQFDKEVRGGSLVLLQVETKTD